MWRAACVLAGLLLMAPMQAAADWFHRGEDADRPEGEPPASPAGPPAGKPECRTVAVPVVTTRLQNDCSVTWNGSISCRLIPVPVYQTVEQQLCS